MLKYVVNGLIRTFGRELIEEWIPLDHVCVTSVSNPEIHIANISIPDVVFQNYSSPFSLVSSNIRRIVVKCDWSMLFKDNKRGKIKVDVDGVDLVVRTKRLEEFDPELCKNLLLKKKRSNLDKWLKFSNLGPKSDNAAKFVNSLSIKAKNVKITFVDDVIYKHPFSIIIKADLITGGGTDAKNPNLTDLERDGFLKGFLSYLLFKSKGVQIEYNSYETDYYSYETPNHENDYKAEDRNVNTEEDVEIETSSSSSHFSDDLFQSDFSEQEEMEKINLDEFLQVKRSSFCDFCTGAPVIISKNRIKNNNNKYLNLLNTPHKRFKLTNKEGICVGISVKIWNFNSLFFVDKIAFEPMQKVKLFLCGNDPEYTKQEHYGYLFDGSVKYSQLKLNFNSEFVHTLHDFIRYVRILSCFKQGATSSCWKVPNLQNAVKYCKLLKRSKLFNLSKDDKEYMDAFENETCLGILVRLHNFMYKKKNRKIVVFGTSDKNKTDSKEKNKGREIFGFQRNITKRLGDPEEDLGIKIENLFKEENEDECEYNEQFNVNFVNIQADEYESNFFNRKYYFGSENNLFGTSDKNKTDSKENQGDKDRNRYSNNWDDWFLGNLNFGIVAPNLRVDLIPTTKAFETLLKGHSHKSNLSDFRTNSSREVLDCLIAELSCFHFNLIQMSERRSSIKIFLSRPMCRYGKVESLIKRRSFSCDLVLGKVFNEKIVAGPMRLLNDHNGFFDNFDNENVNNFSVEDFSKIERYSLISIVIETYVNFVRKNLINMCPVFLVANSGLELYMSLEPNLLKRTLNDLLSFELFLHRTFLTSDYSKDGFLNKNYLTGHYLASTYMNGNYPLKNNTNYEADEVFKVEHFLDNLDDKFRNLVSIIKHKLCMKNRNLVSFTGMEMKVVAFFGKETKKRIRSDAKDMYDQNELVLTKWPYQKGVYYYQENNSKKRNSNYLNNFSGDLDETKTNDDVLITILDNETETPRNSRESIGSTKRSNLFVEEECLDWFHHSRQNPFLVESLDLGNMDSLEASLESINVLVDSYTNSKKITMYHVDMVFVHSDPRSNFGPNPNYINTEGKLNSVEESNQQEKYIGLDKINLLNLELFSFHLIKKNEVILVRLEGADIYSNLLQLIPLLKFSESCIETFTNIKDMVNCVKSSTCFSSTSNFFVPKPNFSFDPFSIGDTADFSSYDPVITSKTVGMESTIFNYLVCYCSPVYEGDLIKFAGNYDVNLLLSAVDFNLFFMKGDNYFNNNLVLYSLVLHKFTLEFLKGTKEKVKLDLRGANLLNYSYTEINENNSFCGKYQDSISTDYDSSEDGYGFEGREYQVLLGCSMNDLKSNKVTVKRVQYGQMLFQLEKYENNFDIKIELRSFNVKYNKGFLDYVFQQYFYLNGFLSNFNLVHNSTSVDKLRSLEIYDSNFGTTNLNKQTNVTQNKLNEKNFKIYVSSLNTFVYLENFGVVLDVFCNFTKRGNKLILNVTRLSTGLLWSNYRRFLTLSMIEMQFKIDDYTVFMDNKFNDNSLYLKVYNSNNLSDNKISIKLSQMSLWYHFNNMYNSFNNFGTLNGKFSKFSSHSSNGVDKSKVNNLFYGLSLLFNEYWFSHVTWCLLPTCPDEDLLVLIFSTKVSSYSRLTPILNKNYLLYYLQLYNPELFNNSSEQKNLLSSSNLNEEEVDTLINDYLAKIEIVENFDNLQVDSELIINRYDSVIVTHGSLKVGEFLLNFDMNMLNDMKEYLLYIKASTTKVSNNFKNLNNFGTINLNKQTNVTQNKLNENSTKSEFNMVSFEENVKVVREESLVVKVDFNLTGNVIYLFSDYSQSVSCSYLPEVASRYKKLRFKILQLYPQNKVVVNLSYSCNLLLQNNLDENLLYKLSKNMNTAVLEVDADDTLEMLKEQFYTFDGNLILTVSKCNLFLDFYINHPYNMENINKENNLGVDNSQLKKKFEFRDNFIHRKRVYRLSSIKLFDDPVDEYEMIKILNVSVYEKRIYFVKNEDRLLLKLLVGKLQVLDYFGKYLLDNVYDTRLRASQVYDVPEEFLSKHKGQFVVNLSKSYNGVQLNLVVDNTLTELQPDFVNLFLSVFVNNKDKLVGVNKNLNNFGTINLNKQTNVTQNKLNENSTKSEFNDSKDSKENKGDSNKEPKKKFKFTLTFNMYEIWVYPLMDFYTRTKDEFTKEKLEQRLRVTPKILKTATEYTSSLIGSNNPLDSSSISNFEEKGECYSRYYEDRIHVLSLLFSGTISNNNNYCKTFVKYFSTTLGTVVLLENNFKVLVDQNDCLIISRVTDPCNRFLMELKDLLINFKIDEENVLFQSQLGNIKLCVSIEDVVRMYYLKDYFYPVIINDVINCLTTQVENPYPEENFSSFENRNMQKSEEFEYHDVDDVFKSFGVMNIDDSNKTADGRNKLDKNEKINKAFKFLDKLHYTGNKMISVNLVIDGFQAIMVTVPNSLILGLLIYQFNFEFLHGTQNSDDCAMFSLSFLFDVSLLNNKFVINDYLLQTTPFKLELMNNSPQDGNSLEEIDGVLKEYSDTVLVIKMEIGATVFDFSNKMSRLVKYFVTTLKKIKDIEKSIESTKVTVYNELNFDICIFSGNIKTELDYFVVPNNTGVKLFTKEFTLLIKNQDNIFSNCDNLLGYIDNNLLFGNTNDVMDFLKLHNYSNKKNSIASNNKRKLTISNIKNNIDRINKYSKLENNLKDQMPKLLETKEYDNSNKYKDYNYIYLGRFEGNENILKLPGLGEIILIEQIHDNVIVSTNIKIENLTDISFVISCSKELNSGLDGKMRVKNRREGDKMKDKENYIFKQVQFDDSNDSEIVLDKFTSLGIPISWYRSKFLPTITYSNKYNKKEDLVQFEMLKNILNNPVGSGCDNSGNNSNFVNTNKNNFSCGNLKNKKEEYLLRFKNGLCFRTSVTSVVVSDVNEVDSMKYVITIEPIFKIFNKLPYDLVVCFSTVKNNSKVNFKNINFDLLPYDKVDSISMIENSGAVKELKPNQSWGIPVYNSKFYLKLILKGISLLNSSSCKDESDSSGPGSMDPKLSQVNLNKQTNVTQNKLNENSTKSEFNDSKDSKENSNKGTFRGNKFRESVERYSLMEYLKYFKNNRIDENDLVYISDMFEINLPNSGNLVTSKSLSYKSGPIFETTFRYLDPLLSQSVYNKNKEIFYQIIKKNFVSIRLNRNKVTVFWPYIFENYTSNFLCFNGTLIPPNFKFFTTSSEANNSKLRAYVKNNGDQYVPTNEVHKLDFTSTTSNRPPINLVVTNSNLKKLNDKEEEVDVMDTLVGDMYPKDDYLDDELVEENKQSNNKKEKKLSKNAECLSLGCTVRALGLTSYPTRVVVFHYYYTFLNKMPYDLVVRNSNVGRTIIKANQTLNVNSMLKQVKLAVHKPTSSNGNKGYKGKDLFLFSLTLSPSKIPLHVQLKPKKLKINSNDQKQSNNKKEEEEEENKFILDVGIVEGNFDYGLPCKFNGLYYIISLATHTTYQLLNLTKYNLFVIDPNYIFTTDAPDSSPDFDNNFLYKKNKKKHKRKKENFKFLKKSKELEKENTMSLDNFKLMPLVLFKNNDRRVAFKNDYDGKWLVYNIDTLKNIQTYQMQIHSSYNFVEENPLRSQQQYDKFKVNFISKVNNDTTKNNYASDNYFDQQQQVVQHNLLLVGDNKNKNAVVSDLLEENEDKNFAAEEQNSVKSVNVYVSCVMKNDGTRVVCFVDDYVLLCKLLQRVEFLQMNRFKSVWSKIIFTLTTPRITTTMSSKKKMVLAAHLNNLYFNVILNNTTSLNNFTSSNGRNANKYSISGRNDWIMDVNLSIKGCHVDHFVQGFIPVILKALNNRHSVQESFLVFKMTCTVFSKTIQTFDKIYFKLSPISMNVEMRVIEQIVDYFESLSVDSSFNKYTQRSDSDKQEQSKNKKERLSLIDCVDNKVRTPVPCYVDTKKKGKLSKKYVKKLTIEPITVVLAIRTSDVKLTRHSLQLLDALPLDTPSICVHFFSEQIVQSVCTYDEMLSLLKNSYFKQLVRQSLPSAWLSNSLAVLYGIIKGFLYFFTQPFSCCKKFKNTVEGFLLGINNGIKYLILFVVGGFAQSIGHLLNIFYKIMGRGRAKPIGILDGLWLGLNSLVLDVFYNPWNRLITEFNIGFGPKRFLRNSYNAVRCLISPVTALVNLMVTIVEGLSNVLLGDFEQFTHLYETEQLSSNVGNYEGTLYQPSQETEGMKNELIRRVKTVGGNMMRML